MDLDQILSQLQDNEGRFPKAAVEEAIAHRDEIVPALLDVLRDVADNPEAYASNSPRFIHIYAMYLLAQFREARAYPLLVRIFSLPGEMPFDLAGDAVTEDLGSILAGVSNGDPAGMASLIENPEANPYVRSAAMTGLLTLVAYEELTREEVIEYFRSLFKKLERTHNYAWSALVKSCCDLWPEELMYDLRGVWAEDLIEDPFDITWKDIEDAYAMGKDACMHRLKERQTLITDTVESLQGWACFEKDRRVKKQTAISRYTAPYFPNIVSPIRRTGPKIGRNDPCPCGSGKKFKKCCGG